MHKRTHTLANSRTLTHTYTHTRAQTHRDAHVSYLVGIGLWYASNKLQQIGLIQDLLRWIYLVHIWSQTIPHVVAVFYATAVSWNTTTTCGMFVSVSTRTRAYFSWLRRAVVYQDILVDWCRYRLKMDRSNLKVHCHVGHGVIILVL